MCIRDRHKPSSFLFYGPYFTICEGVMEAFWENVKKFKKKVKKGVDFFGTLSYNNGRVKEITQRHRKNKIPSAFSSVGRAVDS